MSDTMIILEKPPYENTFPPLRPTEIAEKILLYLIEHDKSNVYTIAKELNENYSTIRKTIYKQLPEYVRYIEVAQKKHKKEKTKLIVLSEKGYEILLYLLYSQNYKGSNKKRIELLTKIFSQLRTLAGSSLPKVLIELPIEYLIVFYPYFHMWESRDTFMTLCSNDSLSDSLMTLLEAKVKNLNKSAFVVDVKLFQLTVPLTLSEAKIILEYVKERMEEAELYLKAILDFFNEKKQIFYEVTKTLSK